MKSCLACGATAPDDAISCAECGRAFAGVSAAAEDGYPQPVIVEARPTGKGPLELGLGGMIFGALLCMVGLIMANNLPYVSAYSSAAELSSASSQAVWAVILQWGGAGLFGLGLMLWSVGYIVKAISFLPGRDDKA